MDSCAGLAGFRAKRMNCEGAKIGIKSALLVPPSSYKSPVLSSLDPERRCPSSTNPVSAPRTGLLLKQKPMATVFLKSVVMRKKKKHVDCF